MNDERIGFGLPSAIALTQPKQTVYKAASEQQAR
jgi:hypothetical protein